ncbi:NAD-dependent epimerase/dehydratase family protein [Pigmentiphaga litoralis]|uniref:NAD-dependent epimerase/dehydratase family protein n=1 Tax=Pigmentiphaga litoralis TaxID=516702 RepID=UPI003B43CC1C
MTLNVLILGANGFVGRKIVARLAATDWATPIAATRRPVSVAGARNVTFDAADASALRAAVREADAVVNCVAASAEVMVASARALREAVLGVVEAPNVPNAPQGSVAPAASGASAAHGVPVSARQVPRVVHFSSMAVYGSALGKVDESHPLLGDVGPYSSAKVEAEKLLADLPGAVMLRPGCIYGPGSTQWSIRIADLLRARRIGDLGPAGDGCSNLIYIDDVVDAVVAALRKPEAGGRAYNLAMRDAPRWNEYFVRYGRALGAVPVKRITPRRLAIERRAAIPLKVLEKIGGKLGLRHTPAVLSPSMLALWQQDIALVPDAAETLLGLRWTPLEAGLRATS